MSAFTTTQSQILALFTCAKRLHEGLYPRQLDHRLGLKPGTVAAVESGRTVSEAWLARLRDWNELESFKSHVETGDQPGEAQDLKATGKGS